MYIRHELGRNGENVACEFLIQSGYEILERNYRSKIGEIDIIAKEKDEIIFVEVKTRGQELYGTPGESVTKCKKTHIYHVAEYYLMEKNIENKFCRIDVIEIYKKNNKYLINHIKNSVLERPKRTKYRR